MKFMKSMVLAISLIALAVSVTPVQAQNVNYGPSIPTYTLVFNGAPGVLISGQAVDSITQAFRAPFDMKIQNFQVICIRADSAGTAVLGGTTTVTTVALVKGSTIAAATTAVASTTVSLKLTNYTGTPASATAGKISQGQYAKFKFTGTATADTVAGYTILLHYVK